MKVYTWPSVRRAMVALTAFVILSTLVMLVVFRSLANPYLLEVASYKEYKYEIRDDQERMIWQLFEVNPERRSSVVCALRGDRLRLSQVIMGSDHALQHAPILDCWPELATRIVSNTSKSVGSNHGFIATAIFHLRVDALQMATTRRARTLLFLDTFSSEKSLFDAAIEVHGRPVGELDEDEFLRLLASVEFSCLNSNPGESSHDPASAKLRQEQISEMVEKFQRRLAQADDPSPIDVESPKPKVP